MRFVLLSTLLIFSLQSEMPDYMYPIAAISNGKFIDPAVPFEQAMVPKKKFECYRSGIKVGHVKVGKFDAEHGRAEAVPFFADTETDAIALNFKPRAKAEEDIDEYTPQQDIDLRNLAQKEFAKHGLKKEALLYPQSPKIAVRDVNRDGVPELVASFYSKPNKFTKNGHGLCFIAKYIKKTLTPEMVLYKQIRPSDLMTGAEMNGIQLGILSPIFFDNVDIDADGYDELILRMTSFEGVTFLIYKKVAGKWKEINTQYNYTCAF